MVAKLRASLELPISAERLHAYRTADGDDLEMLVTYLWNVELCEALYPSLQGFEVSLRNGVHAGASQIYGGEFWFDRPNILLRRQADTIQAARDELAKHGKPRTPGRIIAALSFGFWTTLLNRPYEEPFWHANNLPLLRMAFPNLPRHAQNRKTVFRRRNAIRLLRNRVFHYEHVWDRPRLFRAHQQILEAIGWISPSMRDVVDLCDHFPDVYATGRGRLDATVQAYIAASMSG